MGKAIPPTELQTLPLACLRDTYTLIQKKLNPRHPNNGLNLYNTVCTLYPINVGLVTFE